MYRRPAPTPPATAATTNSTQPVIPPPPAGLDPPAAVGDRRRCGARSPPRARRRRPTPPRAISADHGRVAAAVDGLHREGAVGREAAEHPRAEERPRARMPVVEPADHDAEQERADDVDRRGRPQAATSGSDATAERHARAPTGARRRPSRPTTTSTERARIDPGRHALTIWRGACSPGPPPCARHSGVSAPRQPTSSRRIADSGDTSRSSSSPALVRREDRAGRCSCHAPRRACCRARRPSPATASRSARLRSFAVSTGADPRERLGGEDRAAQRAEVLRRERAAGERAHVRVDVGGRERHAPPAAPVRQQRRARPARRRAPRSTAARSASSISMQRALAALAGERQCDDGCRRPRHPVAAGSSARDCRAARGIAPSRCAARPRRAAGTMPRARARDSSPSRRRARRHPPARGGQRLRQRERARELAAVASLAPPRVVQVLAPAGVVDADRLDVGVADRPRSTRPPTRAG